MIKLFLFFVLLFSSVVNVAADDIQINDISVLGLQRVSSSVVFSAINVTPQSTVSDEELQQLIRDLFDTGFFSDVRVGLDDNVLVIQLTERPVIDLILFEGNKEIPTDALIEGLKSIGLAEGEIFKESALEAIAKQLNAQYSALGRYSAQIDTYVRNIGQNQVVLGVKVSEGSVAKIKHINFVGNQEFDEETLNDLFKLNVSGGWSWFSGSDKYAREKLAGDLETLKSFYLNRGYLNFKVDSTQVSLSPDKETVFITVNITEGDIYTIDNVSIAGDPVLSEQEIQPLLLLKNGEVFSQLNATLSEQAIVSRLNDEGYSEARVNVSPEIIEDTQQANVIFYVDPGEITYVRRIIFKGNVSTSDQVLRREMRQFEGAPVSATKIRQSKVRLERLGLFGEVDLQTYDVPGTTDQVDVEVTVTEQPTASVNFSVGYSGASGVSYGAGLQHNNWLGSGNTFGFNVEQSEAEKSYSLNFQKPYFTKHGVSRGISLFFRERDFSNISVSNYATDAYGMKVNFGYPISEVSRVSFGLGYEKLSVQAGLSTAQEIKGTPDFRSGVTNNAISQADYDEITPNLTDSNRNGFFDEFDTLPTDSSNADYDAVATTTDPLLNDSLDGFLDVNGTEFDSYSLSFGWRRSTHNRGVFPTKGWSQNLSAEVAVPGGDLEYYKLNYRSDSYFPLGKRTAFRFKGRLGYANGYGKTETLPFFENFFAGGVGSVRGFQARSLGPKGTPASSFVAVPADIDGDDDLEYVYVTDPSSDSGLLEYDTGSVNTLGGNTLVELSAELIFPMPFFSNRDSVRTAIFVDSGNAFSTECSSTQQQCFSADFDKLSASAGVSLQWLSPIAPLSFNFSRPLVEQDLDKTEFFQFSLGASF